jgi:glycosyltransferase involved in cell wall biosynthesis
MNICIVAHFAYPSLIGDVTGHIGGVELQTTLLARWLAGRGHRVSLVTWDEGQPTDCVVDGVRVLKLCRQSDGIPGLRFFYPRWTSLHAALHAAQADVYYQNCGEYVTGQVALWCRRNGRAFVYSVAAITDCDPQLPLMPTFRERFLYKLGLRLANDVIAQTRTQSAMLRQSFARESHVIPMPSAGPARGELDDRDYPAAEQRRVLWVGRICEEKRPDRLLNIARACNDLQFDLVGPESASAYSNEVLQTARQLPNVVVHGRANREQMVRFYQRAACLCCTSDTEGFPNVFLEAWSYGLPIVSTLDPDDTIRREHLGYVATNEAAVTAALRKLLASPDEWRLRSRRARAYYLENHHVDVIMPQFEHALVHAVAATKKVSVAAPA